MSKVDKSRFILGYDYLPYLVTENKMYSGLLIMLILILVKKILKSK